MLQYSRSYETVAKCHGNNLGQQRAGSLCHRLLPDFHH
ncbi:unnamed protein product [Tetraodon nigroviridis]|uniref:(spotted green pufferfish) hypothetical protein n=1 Tax=Tetraodon nigroviridis TaxID=99883 RepID=Q4RQN4_TETNG|nr:unnamed protein product [Tetraodon nigroviridis]